ncbi:tensin-1-like isoform X8 [Ptychodera flava]|uniref:tensin-1-like isoform X8 n=2 Tax=Ptychodera flava TaxID=63121 RepID=UPI00396A7A55
MAFSDANFSSFTCPVCRNGFNSARELQQHLTQQHSFGEDLQIGQLEEYESDEEMTVPPEIIESQSHTFKLKTYRHPRDCDLCKQVIWSEGVQCRVCKYACHKKCELKVITTCVPPMNYELPSNEGLAKHGSLKMTQPSVQKDTMSQQKMRLPKGEESMYIQLTYITERILAMTFPANGQESHYSSNLQDITRILKNKHQDKYLVINLSEKRYDMLKLNSQVLDIGWPDRLSPPLEKLCSICKAIESWLSTDPQHVVVIHSKGGLGRLGVVLSAYIEYIRICNGNGNHSPEKFAMERFFVENLSAVTESSQMRYVKYFSGLLSGSIQINNSPLHLHCVVLHGIPNFDGKGGCRPFFKVYQAMQPIYTSGVYTLTSNMSRLAVPIKPAPPLRGDIMVICYHRNSHSSTRDVIFRCQFHTCAIAQYHLAFVKYELDDASKDSKFPDYSKVELLFSDSAASLPGIEEMQDPHIPVDYSQDFVTQLDSYASFGQDTEDTMLETTVTDSDGNMVVQHMHGPVDGSLYAKVNKKGGGDDVTETLFNGPEHDHGHVHTHVHTHGHTHGHTHHHHSAHNHGMVLDLHGSTHDSVDGVTVNDRDHNRNETQVTKHYLTEGLKSPTETIKRGVKKEGMKPNTLKEWFTRRQPNSPADYTHHTLRRNKGGAAEIQDQSTQSQHAKTPTSPPTMSSTLPHSSFPHDSRNYPRDHVYRGGLRDDENPYAEIPDYAASSPTSSMTSGPPQTSSFSSLSEVTNLTYGTSHQSPTGRSASGPDDKSPQGLTMADGQTQSSVVHTMVHHDHLAHGHQGQHGYGHNTEHPGQSGHVHTQITGQYTHHDHMVHGHPGQAGHGHEVDPHGHHVHQHPGQSGHVHTHITGQHSHHDQMVHGHPGQAGHGLEVDPHGHHVHEHTTTNITQQVNERQDHSIHGHPAHVSQSGHGPGVTQPGHGGHVHQHTSTVTGQGHDHAGPISHSQHGPGVSHPGQVGHVQQHTTVTTERQEHVVHGHPDQTSTPGHPSHVHQPSVTVTGQPARGIQVEHVHPENQPGQVTHIHQGGHVTYPAGQVQYTTEKGQYTVQGDKTTHLAGQPDQTGQSSGQPGQTSHVHKVQYTTLQDQLSPKSGHPYLMGHSHSPEVIQKPGETYHLYHDASERAPQSFHLHSRSEPIPQSAEQTQVTRVVQVHSTNNHNQPVGVIDVHHPANQSPQAQPHSHPLANQNQPPSMDRPAVTSHHPSGIQTQYQVTKYEVTEHQHQHSPGEPVSPTKQTWAQRHQQQQQQLSPPPQDTIVQPQQNPPQSLPQQTSTQNQTQVITTQHTWSTQQHMPTQPNLTVQQQKSPTEQTAVEKQPSHVPAVQQPQPAAPTQQAAAEEDPFEGLTWLQKQQKKLELRRQQEKEAQQPGAAPSTSVTKYQYTTYTDRPTYKPLLSPYSTSSQSTTYQYLTPGGQYKPLSPTSQVSTQYNSQGQPQPFTVKDQSPTGFADIDINQLEALAQSLQDESELLDQYTSAPTSPRGSSSTTTVWQSHGRPLSRQHSDRTHDRAVLSHRYGGQTRPYSPYEMDVTVKKLPPPSPRLGRNEAIKTPPPAAPDSGKTTTTTRQIHTEFHQVEEPVVRGPMHGRFFTTPSSVSSSPLSAPPPPRSGYSPSLGDSANRPSVMPPARSEPAETGQKPLPKPENIVSAETPHEEPDLKGLVRDRVAGYHARLIRDELNTERGRQPGRKPAAPLRRSKSAAGYDSETSHRQYITETERVAIVQRRARSPSPEVWMRNPGGIPQYENEYWNKRDGLKSPHTVQDEDTGTTPKFPVSPGPPPKTPYANMVSTPIAFVEKFAVPMETVSGMTPSHGRMHESNNKIIVTRNVPPPTTMPSKSYYVTKMIDSREVYQTSTVSKDSQHEERPADVQHMFRYPDTSYVHTVDQHDAPPQTHQHKPAVTSHPGQGSAINGGPPAPHPSQDKKPNGQPPMMHQWDRPDKAREGQSYTMRELYVETQTQDKKTMAPHDSHVPALAIAEQTSLPHTHPPQQGMPPGQQHTVTRTVVQKTETHTLEKGAPHQPHLHQAPEQQGSPQYQNHPYPGVPSEQAMPHDHRMHGPGKTVVDSSQGVPPNQVRPEGPVVQTHYHIHQTMQEHRNSPVTSLPAPQAGERESPVDQPLTPLHITEDSGSLSECSESPQSSNQGYESATLPFPTSSAMMKERLELQRHQGQPVQQQQVPPNLYPTYSDRARQPGNPPANLYPTFSDRGREHTGHVTITTETTSQYRTMYDNRGRRGDQQKSPDMGRTISRGSASSGENMSGILGSSPRRVTSLGSSHGRGSLTGSDRSGSPPPVGVGNRIYPNGGVSDSGRSSPISLYNQPSLLGSQVSLPDGSEIITKHPTFVKDISSYWYKPNISRDEAIATLKDKPPGSFVVRDSNSFPGAFGLAVKVATPPPNIVQNKKGDLSNELVRHFLIEPNSRGVRLKGCTNEPIFSSLSALVYQHSITPLALPCKLLLPEVDPSGPSSTASSPRSSDVPASPSALLAQGAACNVLYLHSVEMESLTGPNAVRKAVTKVTKLEPRPRVTVVHFKVNSKGITLTDNEKKVFFRRHHPVNSVTYCGMDPENRKWPRSDDSSEADAKIFGFVARKPGSLTDNVCHLFAEHDPEQPASAIVNFVTKVMIGSTQQKK